MKCEVCKGTKYVRDNGVLHGCTECAQPAENVDAFEEWHYKHDVRCIRRDSGIWHCAFGFNDEETDLMTVENVIRTYGYRSIGTGNTEKEACRDLAVKTGVNTWENEA